MKLTPYKELLTMAQDDIDSTLAPIRAKSAKKQAELEMLKLEEKQTNLERLITEMCSVKDVDFNKVIDRMDELALIERRIGQFQQIIDEMFPEK